MAKKISAPKHPIGAELDYRSFLRRKTKDIVGNVVENDDDGIEIIIKEVAKKAQSIGEKIALFITREIKRNFKKDLPKAVEKDLTEKAGAISDRQKLDAFVFNNTALIRNVADEIKLRVYEEVSKPPEGLEPLNKRIQDATGFSDARAKLIARDQTAKLGSELSAMRHVAAGFTRYTWATSGDERVRQEHQDLDGKIYAYGEATDEEEGLPPGQPIQCRCIAEPIFEEFIDEKQA